LFCRFGFAGVVLLLVPAARSGWTVGGAARIAGAGLMLALGLGLQHLGLDRTDEAVSAFLTSLTILFVPMILTLVLRRPPAPVMWVGVVLATAGVWLMTGAAPAGFGVGELLGLSCAVVFALHLLAVNAVAATQDPWRMTAGQFLVVGLVCLSVCALLPGREALWSGRVFRSLLTEREIWQNLALLVLFPTVMSFSIQSLFQPRLDPTRAALIYLLEPVVATAYAWAAADRSLHASTLAGATLILGANVLVELLAARARAGNTAAAAVE
jgi:drug/metabolite transporter (DMT)-like permease